MIQTAITFLETPIGILKIIGDEKAIKWVGFTEEGIRSTDGKVPNVVRKAKHQLKEYFEGKRKVFDIAVTSNDYTQSSQKPSKTKSDIQKKVEFFSTPPRRFQTRPDASECVSAGPNGSE